LPKAIESVLQQSHPQVEIVVVDDGSNDDTRTIAQGYPQVTYICQSNSGLSASRNTGIRHSTGAYLVFLDADDWLYPKALEINLKYLQQNEKLAFVSGSYDNLYETENKLIEYIYRVQSDHYCHFLGYNYIGMIAAVMFPRWALEEYRFDTTLRACEDYDLYLKISRKYPVLHHAEKIAVYRRHSANMSDNMPMMIASALQVLKRQKNKLQNSAEKKAYQISYNALYQQILSQKKPLLLQDISIFKEDLYTYHKSKLYQIFMHLRKRYQNEF
jgi:glycosyltransferase involved in cell wall biosynthesis